MYDQTLREALEQIEKIRIDLLCNEALDAGNFQSNISEQYFLLALSSLEQAMRYIQLTRLEGN